MNNIYQHPEVEARSLWRQRALALNPDTPYSNSPYLIGDTSLHMCESVKQDRKTTATEVERQQGRDKAMGTTYV